MNINGMVVFRSYIALMLLWFLPGFIPHNTGEYRQTASNPPFKPGEKLYFRMNYSIFTVGKAEVIVNPIKYYLDDKSYYKIDIFGRTAGAAAIVSTVDDQWGALIDTEDLLPHKSWRDLEEGRYRRKEYVSYDHEAGVVDVRVVNNETGRLKPSEIYTFDAPYTHDLVSGMIHFRTLDFTRYQLNDTVKMKGFLEDKFYDMKILYKGTEFIKTRLGTIKTYKLVPIMPDNKIFAGENSITAWFAADPSRIPVKVEANMFIGRAGIEIINYEGMKTTPSFIKE